MIVRTARKKNYTVIDNRILEDSRLSFKARGLLCYLLSRPDNWQVNDAHLSTIGPDGEAATRSALKELEETAYLLRIKRKGERGRFEWDTYVYDEPQKSAPPQDDFPPMENPPMEPPQDGFPPVDCPPMENPRVENRTLISTNRISTEKQLLPQKRVNGGSKAEKAKEIGAVHRCWQDNMPGTITPIIGEKINDLIDDYGAEAVIRAIGVAVNAEARSMRFVEGVLRKEKTGTVSMNGNHQNKTLTVQRMEGDE